MAARRVLIVSPHFPPVNAADMQRVRMSLPYFEEFGWKPYVLAVAPGGHESIDPLLNATIPASVPVERVRAVPASIGRMVGVGNIALRALPFLYAAGSRIIAEEHIDLVYFSTTMFFSMPLGRVWKRKLGAPYVLDFQDPWLGDYYERHPNSRPPRKYFVSRRLNAWLEPWTVAEADGFVAVSPEYLKTLHARYAGTRQAPCATLPFGAARGDFEILERHPQPNRHFSRGDGRIHGVYVGRGGDDLAPALEILFEALRIGLGSRPDLFERVALHFVGTDYGSGRHARKTVEPVAKLSGVSNAVEETTTRVPYFEALQLLADADFLLIIGSDDASYTASKIYPYILARRPLLAVTHEQSTMVRVLRDTCAGRVVTFPSVGRALQTSDLAREVAAQWAALLDERAQPPATDWTRFEAYTAREMTRRQCEVFDAVLTRRAAAAA